MLLVIERYLVLFHVVIEKITYHNMACISTVFTVGNALIAEKQQIYFRVQADRCALDLSVRLNRVCFMSIRSHGVVFMDQCNRFFP